VRHESAGLENTAQTGQLVNYGIAECGKSKAGCGRYGHALWLIWFVADMVEPLLDTLTKCTKSARMACGIS